MSLTNFMFKDDNYIEVCLIRQTLDCFKYLHSSKTGSIGIYINVMIIVKQNPKLNNVFVASFPI